MRQIRLVHCHFVRELLARAFRLQGLDASFSAPIFRFLVGFSIWCLVKLVVVIVGFRVKFVLISPL